MFKLSIQGRHFLAGVAGFLVVLVLATPLRGGQKDTPSTMVSLAPQEVKEVCLDMAARDEIHFKFKSDHPVAFNIHYHDSPTVQFPVQLNKVTEISENFFAKVSQSYCLMWTNKTPMRTRLFYQVDGP
jgi:hypothetical protein